MESDIGTMLQSVLSDPGQMERLAEMAKSIMGGEAPKPSDAPPAQPSAAPELSRQDSELLKTLGAALGGRGSSGRSTALLMAMRPYMRPEKQEKLDRAMKLTRMVHIAQAVMGRIGGGNGL